MLKTLLISSVIILLISGCCEKPKPVIRYVDRNMTVKVPVSCEKDVHTGIEEDDNTMLILAKLHTYVLNVKEACKKLID